MKVSVPKAVPVARGVDGAALARMLIKQRISGWVVEGAGDMLAWVKEGKDC